MQTIEKPKVFISYAWSTEKYEMKIIQFATLLANDGIEVVIDKWDLKPGNDKNSFMEQSVNDGSINFVLLLLDKNYELKANLRQGGVGTESQIISEKVYNDTKQDKFIPVIFERNEKGNVCQPTFLKSRIYFDLSITETYYNEYQNLVRYLYGKSQHKKPEIGSKPNWVENMTENKNSEIFKYLKMLESTENRNKNIAFREGLRFIEEEIAKLKNEGKSLECTNDNILLYYGKSIPIRDDYLSLIKLSFQEDFFLEELSAFFENFYNQTTKDSYSIYRESRHYLLHEIFIYTISLLYKNKNYKKIHSIITRTYFVFDGIRKAINANRFFYSRSYGYNMIDAAIKEKDQVNYLTGIGQLWMNRIAMPHFNKEDFIVADCLLSNLFISVLDENWWWFPLTYVYIDEYNNEIIDIAIRLKSKHQLQIFGELFNRKDINDFINLLKKMKTIKREYRYTEAFNSAPILSEFIEEAEIGTLN